MNCGSRYMWPSRRRYITPRRFRQRPALMVWLMVSLRSAAHRLQMWVRMLPGVRCTATSPEQQSRQCNSVLPCAPPFFTPLAHPVCRVRDSSSRDFNSFPLFTMTHAGNPATGLLALAFHIFDCSLGVGIGQVRMAAADRHRALALNRAGNQRRGALFDQWRPGCLITELRRHRIVTKGAVLIVDRLAICCVCSVCRRNEENCRHTSADMERHVPPVRLRGLRQFPVAGDSDANDAMASCRFRLCKFAQDGP